MNQINIHDEFENLYALEFCNEFLNSSSPKFVFGTSVFADSISRVVEIDGFIDDFSNQSSHMGKPIIPIEQVPASALVVSTVVGVRPIKAEKRLRQFRFRSLDYFSFYKYSGLDLEEIWFWIGFAEDFLVNRVKYDWLFARLADEVSKNQLNNILNFRLSSDINYMRGFSPIEDKQYFEDFLKLNSSGSESFADIGAYDGFTSQVFIEKCPDYNKIFLFEPDEQNIRLARENLEGHDNIDFFQMGLSNEKTTLRLDSKGSSSTLGESGDQTVKVDRLDAVLGDPVSFLKMDIEGAESCAIEGAKETIARYHPKLAIAAYHKADDFWRIAEQVLSISDNYQLYLRHYTEGFTETVLFFVPGNS